MPVYGYMDQTKTLNSLDVKGLWDITKTEAKTCQNFPLSPPINLAFGKERNFLLSMSCSPFFSG